MKIFAVRFLLGFGYAVLVLSGVCAAVSVDAGALRDAIEDLRVTFPNDYAQGAAYLNRLDMLEDGGDAQALAALQREALLDNPLLRFNRLLLIKRHESLLGLPQNWQGNSSLPRTGYDNEIAILSGPWTTPKWSTLYRPQEDVFVGDLELHFDADRFMFSMSSPNGPWRIHEMYLSDKLPRKVPLIEEPDVDNYEACYLPDGGIIFASTAPFIGVPCVTGASHVTNLYRQSALSGDIRRLTFEQDHNWCPTVLPNGRILYLRWEYSDIPHFASRILFHMNPDGTAQMEYYGSNSYWPNAMFYARPIPGDASQFIAIVGGHHGVPRMGELTLFDTALGRQEAQGVIQRIPGRGQEVEPLLLDNLVDDSWPRFLHPWPLSDRYFLVSGKLSPQSPWGIYLADVFDNLVLIEDVEGYALFEPTPLQARPVPPVAPDRVDLDDTEALIYLADIYAGPGLDGVPAGTVKALRIFTYHFAYHGMGGQINRVGMDGPWDIKRVLGTTPVEPDGSAFFRVPANTPISIQPLDQEGKAIQLMRSWMTAMPGEILSCVGCHEPQNTTPALDTATAARRPPSSITPWYGPVRGFSFVREVQPVLDAYCVTCHHDGADGSAPDFRDRAPVHPEAGDAAYREGTTFTPAYLALRRYVRTPTMESDMHLPNPYEFHADTTHLVQTLAQGHQGVTLSDEAWDRLITWIDLGAPAHGTWHEIVGADKVFHQRNRRRAMQDRYAFGAGDDDPEEIFPAADLGPTKPNTPEPTIEHPHIMVSGGNQETISVSEPIRSRRVHLGNGVDLELVLVPPGAFIMGDTTGLPDEHPVHEQVIDEPFWLGRLEVTNAQYALFDPNHDSRLEHGDFLHFSVQERGYPLNEPEQPVVRVRWRDAVAFCNWMSAMIGETVTLPTEAQWEYACRAGSISPLWYGTIEDDFSDAANLADYSLAHIDTFEPWGLPSGALAPWRPAMMALNDGHRVSAPAGAYRSNPFGLYDMHGNVAEWTRSDYGPYPYVPEDGRNNGNITERKVARGGSWYDMPQRARSAARRAYPPWQPVFDVGFRVAVLPD